MDHATQHAIFTFWAYPCKPDHPSPGSQLELALRTQCSAITAHRALFAEGLAAALAGPAHLLQALQSSHFVDMFNDRELGLLSTFLTFLYTKRWPCFAN